MKCESRLPFLRLSTVLLCLALAMWFVAAARAAGGPGDSPRWYKGNTHSHSHWSDGDEFPEMVADWYKCHGYDFLALSDHRVLMTGEKCVPVDRGERHFPSSVVEKCQKRFGCDWLELRTEGDNRQVKLKTLGEIRAKLEEPGRFLLIENEEIDTKVGDHNVHMNAVNLAELIQAKAGQTVAEAITLNTRMIQEQAERLGRPILAQANHPDWPEYDVVAEDLAEAMPLRFFEVCNAGPWGRHFGDATHPGLEKLWDIANTIRIAKMKAPPLYGIGSDDAHHYQEFTPQHANPGRAFVMVHAKQLSADALIDAMNRGDFYASTGVTLRNIDYDAQKRIISVEVEPEAGVSYTIEFIGTPEGVDPTGEPVDGQPSTRPGRKYSPEVGKVFACVQGTSATYQLTGKEIYVRAVVHSNKPIANAPSTSVQQQEAWCQPVGWEKR